MELPISHTTRMRVDYADTDQMGVAHHAVYLIWFERARVELLREIGADYKRFEERGLMMPVRNAHVRYHQPARFDDELEVTASMTEMRRASCLVKYTIRRVGEEKLVAEGEIELAMCDHQGRPARNGPATLRAMMEESRATAS